MAFVRRALIAQETREEALPKRQGQQQLVDSVDSKERMDWKGLLEIC